MARSSSYRNHKSLDAEALERLAIAYVGRFATTRVKLASYLRRKLAERDWEGEGAPPVEAIVARFAEAGYIDDRGFAEARAAAFVRRGYGARRLADRLRADGVEGEDAAAARDLAENGAWDAALAFARRRRIGPFAAEPLDPDARRRALAAMLRAGHSLELARKIIACAPDDVPDRIS
ncbi:regulatory protein RecX [Sphingomonas fennica]|uniref:RecX family transcriptional regulator n=1 Tax=Edaphosphingomonas fennica TaxID=114404 RepID=A0A2T4HMR6_9SPHN|nr:RecX family transcriptional regulator [Sphingomonas fennica]PTD17094.1 RecX family transcriptional regulator [Sphingomonas fennica]